MSYKNNDGKNVNFMGRLPSSLRTYEGLTNHRLKFPPNGAPYGDLKNIPKYMIKGLESEAFRRGISVAEILLEKFDYLFNKSIVRPVSSKTVRIDNIRLTSLIDGEQIFPKTLEFLKSAENFIQIKMFEFQNLKVDGNIWSDNGAKHLPGAKEQQQILNTIIKKKQSNPDMKIQVILDAHKWYINGKGKKTKHYGNQEMIKYLKEKGIDVVFDTVMRHEKVLIVDGKKAIVSGMNWGNHSTANHDGGFAIERFKGKNSMVDNLVEDFNIDWRYCWYKIGKQRFIKGPLNEEEQKLYGGLNKEIKEENVKFYDLLKDFYDTPEAKTRYSEGRLDLIEAKPVENPPLKILKTRPRELEEISERGSEEILEYLMHKLKTAKRVRGELFFFTDKEAVKTIIKRFKAGELDAKFIIEKNVFPYCENAYDEMKAAGIDIRIYKGNKKTHQRMHAKWAVFDDEEILAGSANLTARGLRQNLQTGMRYDMPLNVEDIEKRIKYFIQEVKPHEDKLHIPNIQWDGSEKAYEKLKNIRKVLKSIYKKLNEKGKVKFKLNEHHYFFEENRPQVIVDDVVYPFKKGDERTIMAELRKIKEFYKHIQKRHLSKERYKRGNNEIAVVVKSPNLAKTVYLKQFDLDYKHSASNYEAENLKIIPSIPPKLDIAG
jgi:phosphatidylserine/phosphatidylglycerophosphate/cardiolipin synthase-like enzyme